MRYMTVGLATALILAGTAPGIRAADPPPKQRTSAAQGRFILAREISSYFHTARSYWFQQDNVGAAHKMLQAAALLKIEADHATGDAKKALMASINQLDQASYAVQMGGLIQSEDTDQLDAMFARAEWALSVYQLSEAKASMGKDDKATGQHLEAAVIHLRNGMGWAWTQIGEKEKKALLAVGQTAKELKSETPPSVSEIEEQTEGVVKAGKQPYLVEVEEIAIDLRTGVEVPEDAVKKSIAAVESAVGILKQAFSSMPTLWMQPE